MQSLKYVYVIYKELTVFRECYASNRSLMSRKVGNICSFFQIPDFNHGVFCTSSKNQTIRMELSTC